ncbi:methylmalonyl-CoA mutase subunit beta [Flavobacterium sp.]|uniref:methylmalonyl-CoA mutase subunit beta n=1 Tax=Flavobacterium sp. TaxID=239 RepID=UPI0038FC958C
MHKLFNDFDPISSKQWKQRIQFELDGADYNDTLIWNSPEGIQVKPFYHNDEFQGNVFSSNPSNSFQICQDIFVHDVAKSNFKALDSIRRGAESISFTIPNKEINIKKLLDNIPLEKILLYFNFDFIAIELIKEIDIIAEENKATIFCNIDPIGFLAKDGNWFTTPEKNNFETLNLLSKATKNISLISVNSGLYQNAGATMVQQIAYSLSHANEYLNRINAIQKPIVFRVSVGSNYFFEIAKIRALRLLFQLILKEYDYKLDCHIIVSPTKRNKTLYDYNINMLRTTTECMSGILGGADAIINLPFDALYNRGNEFADRIARNQLLILKNESHFDKVINPVDGSYYIETLTQQLADKALTLFKDIEAQGGFLKQLNDGTIKRKIQESADKEQELFDSNKEILVGTNKYINPKNRMKDKLELFPFLKIKPRKTLIKPILETRLAEKIEQIRLLEEEKNIKISI